MNSAVLPYLVLDWDCQFEVSTKLPSFKGSMLRGTLGHALKATVCAVRVKICESCLLRSRCLYAQIFEYKPNQREGRRQAALPHPYVFEYPLEEQTFSPEDIFRFRLVLLGSYMESLPYWIYSVQQMGTQGLGPRRENGQRARFSLKTVFASGQRIFTEHDTALPENLPQQGLNWEKASGPIDRLQIKLLTPLRTKIHNRFATDLDFPLLVRLCLRRLQSLQDAFGVKIEPEGVVELLALANEVRMVRKQVWWQDQGRYSNRQQQAQQFGGLLGEIEIEGELAPFWPLLRVAELMHLGKETSFGLGKLSLLPIR